MIFIMPTLLRFGDDLIETAALAPMRSESRARILPPPAASPNSAVRCAVRLPLAPLRVVLLVVAHLTLHSRPQTHQRDDCHPVWSGVSADRKPQFAFG